jgi:hypothetical protein
VWVARARDIIAGKKVNAYQVKAFFDRHRQNYLNAKMKGLRPEESRAIQAWLIWGGEPLRKQVEREVAKHEKGLTKNPPKKAKKKARKKNSSGTIVSLHPQAPPHRFSDGTLMWTGGAPRRGGKYEFFWAERSDEILELTRYKTPGGKTHWIGHIVCILPGKERVVVHHLDSRSTDEIFEQAASILRLDPACEGYRTPKKRLSAEERKMFLQNPKKAKKKNPNGQREPLLGDRALKETAENIIPTLKKHGVISKWRAPKIQVLTYKDIDGVPSHESAPLYLEAKEPGALRKLIRAKGLNQALSGALLKTSGEIKQWRSKELLPLQPWQATEGWEWKAFFGPTKDEYKKGLYSRKDYYSAAHGILDGFYVPAKADIPKAIEVLERFQSELRDMPSHDERVQETLAKVSGKIPELKAQVRPSFRNPPKKAKKKASRHKKNPYETKGRASFIGNDVWGYRDFEIKTSRAKAPDRGFAAQIQPMKSFSDPAAYWLEELRYSSPIVAPDEASAIEMARVYIDKAYYHDSLSPGDQKAFEDISRDIAASVQNAMTYHDDVSRATVSRDLQHSVSEWRKPPDKRMYKFWTSIPLQDRLKWIDTEIKLFKLARGIPLKNPPKKTKSKAPTAKALIAKCQKLWEAYCKKPGVTKLRAVAKHCEAMKSSKAKSVAEERKRCMRSVQAEAKERGWKL